MGRKKKEGEKRTPHKEVYLTHGRGEHPSKLGGLPVGDRRSPLRINKFDPQKTNNKPRQIKKSVGVLISLKRQNTISLVCVDNISNL